ncbi:M15 family metallopeptidase [Aliidiomarina soli]|uniref:Peptidase M15 n=1 Tax=Aliidiomarina soli TaxID=1928574 RepID=A0A432WMC3_9GAMM|nr:M15 family metallopeptidase [Aliidiomarina soli]RUO34908.1 peptidase M15 [Aliidiomarina soli]
MTNPDYQTLTGLTATHVAAEIDGCPLHPQTVAAFTRMQQAAASAGHDLRVASGFRSYQRQLAIWQRKVDALGTNPADEDLLSILHWSAMPGASRHHWGSDLDVFDKTALGEQRLQLEPWEYVAGGPCAPLYDWLQQHAHRFSFYWPYDADRGGVAPEPWHLSYAPVSQPFQQAFTLEHLQAAWLEQPPAAFDWLQQKAPQLFARYVQRVAEAPRDSG